MHVDFDRGSDEVLQDEHSQHHDGSEEQRLLMHRQH